MAVAFIPLRGGSKSIPLKNIKSFLGKPLCYWVIEALQNTPSVSKIIVATDSKAIMDTVIAFSFSKLEVYERSAENAQDTSSTESVMLEYLAKHPLPKNELFILVQATNPFIRSADIEFAIKKLESSGFDSLLTCVRYKRFFWNEDGTPKNYDYKKRPRRQEFAGELMENGAFYISKAGDVVKNQNRLSGKVAIYEMPEYSSFEIDEPDDWIIMEHLFEKHMKQVKSQN